MNKHWEFPVPWCLEFQSNSMTPKVHAFVKSISLNDNVGHTLVGGYPRPSAGIAREVEPWALALSATALPQRNEPGVSHQCGSSLSHIGFHSAAHGREGLSATWEAFQNYVYICSRWTIWMWNSKKLFWRSSPYLKEFGGNTFNSSSGLVDNLSVDYDCFSWRVAGFWCCPRDLDGPGETAE